MQIERASANPRNSQSAIANLQSAVLQELPPYVSHRRQEVTTSGWQAEKAKMRREEVRGGHGRRARTVNYSRGSAAAGEESQVRQVRRDGRAPLRLGVDPKHADQMVRGTVVLPNGLGKIKSRAGHRLRRQAEGSEGSRRRLRRRRRHGHEDPGRLDRLRRRDRHAGHDAQRSAGWARCSVRAV